MALAAGLGRADFNRSASTPRRRSIDRSAPFEITKIELTARPRCRISTKTCFTPR
jgi:hypothetical protein